MGYACPVCETPQADARHLANHLAFTAVLRGGDHEAWLDEHCPGWNEAGEARLADRIAALADEANVREVPDEGFDDHDHDDRESDPGDRTPASGDVPREVGGETRDVLERARELTRRRREGDDGDGADG